MRVLFCISVLLASGCGGNSIRFGVAPTLDTQGALGVEAFVSLALGVPIAKRQLVQISASGGAGYDPTTKRAMGTERVAVSYARWEPDRLIFRAGAHAVGLQAGAGPGLRQHYGIGAHVSVTPGITDYGSWLASYYGFGLELRGDYLFGVSPAASRGQFALAVVGEVSFLVQDD